MTVGKRLKQIRKSNGFNQADFGKLFDLSDRAYKNYELDIRGLPSRIAVNICEKYDISANWLLLGRGAMKLNEIATALAKAKSYAKRYAALSDRVYDEDRLNKLEAMILDHILTHGDQGEAALKTILGVKLNDV